MYVKHLMSMRRALLSILADFLTSQVFPVILSIRTPYVAFWMIFTLITAIVLIAAITLIAAIVLITAILMLSYLS